MGGILEPKATRRQQHQQAVLAGEQVSVQGFEQRVEQAESVTFMEGLLKETLTRVVRSGQRRVVFPAFNGVYLTDCTRLVWPGLGKKAGVRLNIQDGQLEVSLMGLKDNDQKTEVVERAMPKGALHVADLGFFKLERFKRWSAQGIYWLTRYKIGTLLFHPDGTPIDLAAWLQQASAPLNLPVLVGAARLPATLLAAPLSDEALAKRTARLKEQARLDQKPLPARQLALSVWTIYLSNVPNLTFDHAFILARARWQIELLFKLWKSHALLLTSRSTNPIRQQTEGLAKFIGVILSHWCLLLTGWHQDALSPLDALRLLRLYVPARWRALHDPLEWLRLFDALRHDLSHYAPLSKRPLNPLAFQLWAEFDFAFP